MRRNTLFILGSSLVIFIATLVTVDMASADEQGFRQQASESRSGFSASSHDATDSKNDQRRSADLSKKEKELQELGLVDEEGKGGFFIGGLVLIFIGLVVIGVSVWYYLKPEPPVLVQEE
jgi:hypothetical protein